MSRIMLGNRKVTYSILCSLLCLLLVKFLIFDVWVRGEGKSEIAAGRITQWEGGLSEGIGKWAFFYYGDSWETKLIQKGIENSESEEERFFGLAFLGWKERYGSIEWLRQYSDPDPNLQIVKEAVRIGLEIGLPFSERSYSEYSSEYLRPTLPIIKNGNRDYELEICLKFQKKGADKD